MKGFLLLIIGIIIAVLVVGGAVAVNVLHDVGAGVDNMDSSVVNKITSKVKDITSSGDSSSDNRDSGNIIDDIVSEEVKYNYQNDGGYYREVTYKDGGFRQYDTESGELIGSSYDSDQDKLPSMG